MYIGSDDQNIRKNNATKELRKLNKIFDEQVKKRADEKRINEFVGSVAISFSILIALILSVSILTKARPWDYISSENKLEIRNPKIAANNQEDLYKIFTSIVKKKSESTFELIKISFESRSRSNQYLKDYGYVATLEDYIVYMQTNDTTKEFNVGLFLKELDKVKKAEPYSNLPKSQSRVILNLERSIQKNDIISSNLNIKELSGFLLDNNKTIEANNIVIESQNKDINKLDQSLYLWTALSIILGVLSIVLGMISIILAFDPPKKWISKLLWKPKDTNAPTPPKKDSDNSDQPN